MKNNDFNNNGIKLRPNFIDIAKVLMIYLVVVGHYGYALRMQFEECPLWFTMHTITLFHMPFFFFVSGMLYKQTDLITTIKKGWIQLVVPYIALSIINLIIMSSVGIFTGEFSLKQTAKVAAAIVSGSDCRWGRWWYADSLWFCYALFIIKVLTSLIKRYTNSWGGVFIPCVLGTLLMYLGDVLPFRLDSSLVGFIFFTIGNLFKNKIIRVLTNTQYTRCVSVVAAIILIVSAYINLDLSDRNGACSIDAMRYGPIPPLFIVSGISGSLLTLGLCSLFSKSKNKSLIHLSNGTIIILGFHWLMYVLIFSQFKLPSYLWANLIVSFVILLMCYPIIIMAERYCPLLLGNRKA